MELLWHGDTQVECSTLLRSCLTLPKVSFILCACPASHIQITAAELGSATRCTLETPQPSQFCMQTPFVTTRWVVGGISDRIARHNAICDVIFAAVQLAALAPSKETPRLSAWLVSSPG